MNSDLMPSSESSETSDLSASMEAQNNSVEQSSNADSKDKAKDKSQVESNSTESESTQANEIARQQPIPPPSEPMQYRAIGLVRGRYVASSEQFTQGALVTPDNVELDAVLLGRIMSLVKNHLDLEKDHLWVVYPRTRQENDNLHLQIVGVWEPEKLAVNRLPNNEESPESTQTDTAIGRSPSSSKSDNDSSSTFEEQATELTPSSEIPDGGFSVRGEVVYQSFDAGNLVVKIKQAPRKNDDKPKYFKLKLTGKLETKAVGKFWDFKVQREADLLIIEKAEFIADLPKKRRPPFNKGGGGGRSSYRGGPGGGGSKPYTRRSSGETPRPVKKAGQTSEASKPASDRPAPPKPVKRQKPPEG